MLRSPLLTSAVLSGALLLACVSATGQVPAETVPSVLNPNAVKVPGLRFEYAELDALLMANVVDGKVDYLNIRSSWMPQLERFLDSVSKFDADTLERDEQLALYINLYNAVMIHTIIERFHESYSCTENNKSIFNEPLVRVGGRTVTLNYLEHKLIRGTFQDPRIHGALVCGGLGCPALANFAFRGDLLSEQLDARMKAWVTDATRNVVDDKAKTAVLSKLFRSYAADFGGEDKAIAAVDSYHPADLSQYKVTFDTNYDWTLNLLPPRYGKWVSITSAQEGLAVGKVCQVVKTEGDVLTVVHPGTGFKTIPSSATAAFPPSAPASATPPKK